MSSAPTLIFDFDSTLVGFETLEVLAELALETFFPADAFSAHGSGHVGRAGL